MALDLEEMRFSRRRSPDKTHKVYAAGKYVILEMSEWAMRCLILIHLRQSAAAAWKKRLWSGYTLTALTVVLFVKEALFIEVPSGKIVRRLEIWRD